MPIRVKRKTFRNCKVSIAIGGEFNPLARHCVVLVRFGQCRLAFAIEYVGDSDISCVCERIDLQSGELVEATPVSIARSSLFREERREYLSSKFFLPDGQGSFVEAEIFQIIHLRPR